MRGMKKRIITCLGDRTRSGTFFIIASVSRTDNFMNVFNSVTPPRVFAYRCVLHYFLTMPVGFNFNLTYGLKPVASKLSLLTDDPFSKFSGSWPLWFQDNSVLSSLQVWLASHTCTYRRPIFEVMWKRRKGTPDVKFPQGHLLKGISLRFQR